MKTRDEMLLSIKDTYPNLYEFINSHLMLYWLEIDDFLLQGRDFETVDTLLSTQYKKTPPSIEFLESPDYQISFKELVYYYKSGCLKVFTDYMGLTEGLKLFQQLNREVGGFDKVLKHDPSEWKQKYINLMSTEENSIKFFLVLCENQNTKEILLADNRSALLELATFAAESYPEYVNFLESFFNNQVIDNDQLERNLKINYERTPKFKQLIEQVLIENKRINKETVDNLKAEYPDFYKFISKYNAPWMGLQYFLSTNPSAEKLKALNAAFKYDETGKSIARVKRYTSRAESINLTLENLANCSDPAMMITLLYHGRITDVVYKMMQLEPSEELRRVFEILTPYGMPGVKQELLRTGEQLQAMLQSYKEKQEYKAEADLLNKDHYQALKDLMRISLDDLPFFEKLMDGLVAVNWKSESSMLELAEKLKPYLDRMPALKAYIKEAVKGTRFAPILEQTMNPVVETKQDELAKVEVLSDSSRSSSSSKAVPTLSTLEPAPEVVEEKKSVTDETKPAEPERVEVLASSSRSSSRSSSASSFSSSIFQEPVKQPEIDPAFIAIINGIRIASQNRLRSRFSIFVLAHRERESSFQKALDFIKTPAELRQLIESQTNRYHNNQSDLPKCLDADESVKQRLSRPIHNRLHGYHGYWHFLQESQRALQGYEDANPTHRIFNDTL